MGAKKTGRNLRRGPVKTLSVESAGNQERAPQSGNGSPIIFETLAMHCQNCSIESVPD
jgi:hypothetical protein